MATANEPLKQLPPNPSLEHLRKQAKRAAKARGVQIAAAQHQLAQDYGFARWADLVRHVDALAPPTLELPPLHRAARDGNFIDLLARISAGDDVDAFDKARRTALWHACDGEGPIEGRLEAATRLLDAGASPRLGIKTIPIQAAAARGPWAMVALLITRGALIWQDDDKGRVALDHARSGDAPDRELIVHRLDRPVIEDPAFKSAVVAIQGGDVRGLEILLQAHPNLLHDRAVEPDCYPATDYFSNPKLFWFVANNPNLAKRLPDNILEVMEVMIARGVATGDLTYALELAMTSDSVSRQGLLPAFIARLLAAGASPTRRAVLMTLGHGQTAPIEILLRNGLPLTAPIAAGLGRLGDLERMLPEASREERQAAFGMAALNGQTEAAALCLDAGADIDAALPVHGHGGALHQAVAADDLAMTQMLVSRGARREIADTLWNSTPLGWAAHLNRPRTRAYLESLPAS